MKNISILKTLRIIIGIAFLMQLINLLFGKEFGENGEKIFMVIATVLFAVAMILSFGFGKKLEQEKIEKEQRSR